MRDGLFEVKDVNEKTGLTRKQLHQCDEMGLVKPTKVLNSAGYKLYDEEALDKLQEVGLYASFGLSMQEIKERMLAPDVCREEILGEIVELLTDKCEHLLNQIAVAEQLRTLKYRIPEYDSYVIRHMDDVGRRYRRAFEPESLRNAENYLKEMDQLTGGDTGRVLSELIHYGLAAKAKNQS